jgi:hypothetical protein
MWKTPKISIAGRKTLNAVNTSVRGSKTRGNEVLLMSAPARIIEFAPLVPAVETNSKIKIPATRCKKNSGPWCPPCTTNTKR